MFTIQDYELHEDLFYDPEDHFWLKVEGTRARIGYDPLIQESMGAFVVVQLDEVKKPMKKGQSFGTIEAEKYVGPLKSPVSGKIVSVNENVVRNPRLANTSPYHDGWFVEIELTNFPGERNTLITGADAIRAWFQGEIEKYEDKGWLAQA